MTQTRPLFNESIAALEAAFEDRVGDKDFLAVLAEELTHRSSQRAGMLAKRVQEQRGIKVAPPAPDPVPPPRPAATQFPTPPSPTPHPLPITSAASAPTPMPAVTNAPESVMAAWTALEVLSPATFENDDKLPGADQNGLVSLEGARMVWEGTPAKSKPDYKLYYHVVLGTLDATQAYAALFERFTDARAERPAARGYCVAASVVLDQKGRLAGTNPVAISSFAWALPVALRGDLHRLADWSSVEQPLHDELLAKLKRTGEGGEELPQSRASLMAGFAWLVERLGAEGWLEPPRIAVRAYEHYRQFDPPDPLLLNSFFLKDLARARALFQKGKAGRALRLYAGLDAPKARQDLLSNRADLERAVAPAAMPVARWPSPGRHPLVLLQQAAVNLAARDLKAEGMLAVNGPPGTGKTTLLRDVVASVVAERAMAMCVFDDPTKAFSHAGHVKLGDSFVHLYQVHASLKGHELLVASSNNKAVENVSAELPSIDALAGDTGLQYFKPLSDALSGRTTWGLGAAVLGNQKNRGAFAQTFWWNKDVGLSAYLSEAAGTPQVFTETDGSTRRPKLAELAHAPNGHPEALARWKVARERFQKVHQASQAALKSLDITRGVVQAMPGLQAKESEALAAQQTAMAAFTAAGQAHAAAEKVLSESAEALHAAQGRMSEHQLGRPGFWARLFGTQATRAWSQQHHEFSHALERCREQYAQHAKVVVQAKAMHQQREADAEQRQTAWAKAGAELNQAQAQVEKSREKLGPRLVDEQFMAQAHASLHRSVPWADADVHALRDAVFAAAMDLHKAFIDASAKQLRGNLGALMSAMGPNGGVLTGPKAALLPDAWASLFLVVPVVSTTFASVDRMMGALPPESLGWLLIDEAGQAVPQAAVGALMRVKRAVVVGDPVQVEPVVTLPEQLTEMMCRRFGVEPDLYNAPTASAQTVADAASTYMAEFQTRLGSRTVGVPLLVHRRCSEPMFGIANEIAYQGLMVQAKPPKSSAIRDCLGPSRWMDVRGQARDKWCPEEGKAVLELLRELAAADVAPNLYIVTPFNIVQRNLRQLIRDSGVCAAWTGNAQAWCNERIGTVHTVQGREAEAVIVVLGAPDEVQRGARGWAGGRPNLLNVALTRAQEAVYVVGNRALWKDAGVFRALDQRLA